MTINELPPPRIELDHIYNMDCTEGLALIPDGSVDCIIVDPPYGTMKGYGKSVAAIREKRHFIGFELDKGYFDKACRRIRAEQAQLTLF